MIQRVLEVMTDVLGKPVSEDASYDAGYWDSVEHLSIVMALEQEFGIQFATDEMMEITSVPLIVEAVKKHAG